MENYLRIFLIITDSLGIGYDSHANVFGDFGANTFYSVSKTNLLQIPTWKKLGIDSVAKLEGFNKIKNQEAYTAKLEEISNAKDTLAGHWEMMGIETKHPFPTFPSGFPKELIFELEKDFGKKIVGNKAASGTEIINELADEENNNDKIIVYTSADSVLQICGNEEKMGLEKLYKYCKIARDICSSKPEWNVGRIIARPYKKINNKWERTSNRHDFAISPKNNLLNDLQKNGIETIGIGKIFDIFNGQGIDKSFHSSSDEHGMDICIELALEKTKNKKLIFINLVDFDSKYGHRRDAEGYAENINKFDIKLTKLINSINENDLILISSDHGNDPSFKGTDHTREFVPLTIYSHSFKQKPKFLGTFQGFGTIGNIIAKNFNVQKIETGEDITNLID